MSNVENFIINSPIELSGLDDSKPYIELTSRLCWFDRANLNNVGISSKSIESIETLKDMPVVAKINTTGTKFGGHEVAIDDKGNVVFNTSAYGVHTAVWQQEEEVNIPNVGIKKLPCLYAKAKIWKRFSSIIELIKNKFVSPEDYNGGLWSSWELQGSEYHIDEYGGKIYDTYQFLSNCLIDMSPAFADTSKGLQVASDNSISIFTNELEIAYINDINNIKTKEDLNTMSKANKDTVDGIVSEVNENTQPQVNIQVNLDETAKLLSTKEIEISNLESKIVELETKISTLESEITTKTDALVKASEEISNLQVEISTLQPLKEKAELEAKLEAEKILAEKQEDIKKLALKGGFISVEEFESSEIIKSAIENVDTLTIKSIIAERFIKRLEETSTENVETTSTIETSTIKESANANLNVDDENFNPLDVMASFLKK